MKADKKIEEMLEYLNINAKAFSEKLGYERPQIIYDIQKGKTKRISEDLAVKITSVFPMIRKSWLLADEGEMLLDTNTSRSHEIKYYPDVWGSLGDRLLGNADERTAEIWHMPAYSDCQYAINAYGDSMSPLIKSGDVVLLSEWNENYIEWGLVYLVITRAGHRTIKRLYANGDDGVICRSENHEKNPDFLIQKSDILKLYIVKGRLSRDTL